jgi:DNA-binding beta-propeller fold protein YncE
VAGIVFSPGGKTAYVVAGSLDSTPLTLLNPATVTPINTATNTPGQPIRVSAGAGTMAITTDGKTLYVAGPDTITPISTATNTPGKLIRPADYRGIPELWITP